MTKLLKVDGSGFAGGAVWERDSGGAWACIQATQTFSWMRGLSPEQVRAYLDRRGWRHSWGDDTPENRAAVGLVPADPKDSPDLAEDAGILVDRWQTARYKGKLYRVVSISPKGPVHLAFLDGSGHFWARGGSVTVLPGWQTSVGKVPNA
jgi:hypothetical protein